MDLKFKPRFKKTGPYSKVLIDGDFIAFSCAAASDGHYYVVIVDNSEVYRCRYKKELDQYLVDNPGLKGYTIYSDYEPETLNTCLHSVKMLTSSIIRDCGGGNYQVYLTGKNNFRYKINPQYKANRYGKRRPFHFDSCREYLVEVFGAVIADNCEADDLLGINQTRDSIIASKDKDLDTIPGYHYNWSTKELYNVSEEQSRINLYSQILSGDTVDNIEGIRRVAKKTALKLLKGSKSTSNRHLYERCLQVYQQYKSPLREGFKSQELWATKRVEKVAKQVYILREEGVMWTPPVA